MGVGAWASGIEPSLASISLPCGKTTLSPSTLGPTAAGCSPCLPQPNKRIAASVAHGIHVHAANMPAMSLASLMIYQFTPPDSTAGRQQDYRSRMFVLSSAASIGNSAGSSSSVNSVADTIPPTITTANG